MKSYIKNCGLVFMIAFLCAIIVYIMFSTQLFLPTFWLSLITSIGGFVVLVGVFIALGLYDPRYSRQAYKKYGSAVTLSASSTIVMGLFLSLVQDFFLYYSISAILFFFVIVTIGTLCCFLYELHYCDHMYCHQYNYRQNQKENRP